jgi:hypothetical protein
VRFQASAVVYLRPLLFWDVTWHRMAAGYLHFRAAEGSYLQGSAII